MACDWVRLGQPYDGFWRLTLGEFAAVAQALAGRERDRVEMAQALNHQLAQLIGVAVNAPDKVPSLDELRAAANPAADDGGARMRSAMLGLMNAQAGQVVTRKA